MFSPTGGATLANAASTSVELANVTQAGVRPAHKCPPLEKRAPLAMV